VVFKIGNIGEIGKNMVKTIIKIFIILGVFIGSGFYVPVVFAETTTTPIIFDTILSDANPDSNYGDATLDLQIQNPNHTRIIGRITLPTVENGVINSSTLKIYASNKWSDSIFDIELHELTVNDWQEMQATWNIKSPGNNWSSAGGDFNSTVISTIVAQDITVNSYNNWPISGPDAENSLSMSFGNSYNFLLKGEVENTTDVFNGRFTNREAGSNGPFVLIDYYIATSSPPASTTPLLTSNFRPFFDRYKNPIIWIGIIILLSVIIGTIAKLGNNMLSFFKKSL